jgi:2,5-diamino-6-(ribosylamino)-4(3H)-pyrimidinone 5'-phosphate reductase
VGVGTVIADDPHLTIKNATYEENPVRIVLDSHGRIPSDARVLDDRAPTVIVTDNECTKDWGSNVTVIRGGSGRINLTDVLHILAKDLGIENMIVEGGGEVIASFFREKLVDRYSVFVGGLLIGGRTSPTPADGEGWLAPEGIKLSLDSAEVLGNGALLTFTPKY